MWANAQRDVVALPNIGGALYSTPQSLADAHYYMPCINAPKTRNPLKVAGVPQTNETISAASGSKFTLLWGHLEDILLINNFFPIVDTCLSCEDIAIWRTYCWLTTFFPIVDTCLSCEDIAGQTPRWWFLATFLRPVFSASRVQHISDVHSKFTLGPHHVWKYGRHAISDSWD